MNTAHYIISSCFYSHKPSIDSAPENGFILKISEREGCSKRGSCVILPMRSPCGSNSETSLLNISLFSLPVSGTEERESPCKLSRSSGINGFGACEGLFPSLGDLELEVSFRWILLFALLLLASWDVALSLVNSEKIGFRSCRIARMNPGFNTVCAGASTTVSSMVWLCLLVTCDEPNKILVGAHSNTFYVHTSLEALIKCSIVSEEDFFI